MNVLSLFDGIGAAKLALDRTTIKVDNYFASEIDQKAILIANKNFPNIIQLGDINNWKSWNLPKIDLIIGGFPCQSFSRSGKGLNFDDPRGKLFFILIEILKYYKPKYFLFENAKMKKEWQNVISSYIGVQPILLNSSLVSAQNRERNYWTNVEKVQEPINRYIFIDNILENNVDNKYICNSNWIKWWNENKDFQLKKKYSSYCNLDKKAITMTARQYASWNGNFIYQLPHGTNKGGEKGKDGKTPTMTISSWQHNNLLVTENNIRRLTPIECERLQTFSSDYTKHPKISDNKRYQLLGNSFTVEIISHILSHIKES